jgi:hypothetical protein
MEIFDLHAQQKVLSFLQLLFEQCSPVAYIDTSMLPRQQHRLLHVPS